jgi:hypothetical protein
MKVCAKNRKALALLALGALEAPEAELLRAHVASCSGCRGYLQEIEHVAEQVRAAEAPPEIEPSPFLHRRVRNRLLAERPRANFSWRLVVPALAAMVFLLFILPRSRTLAPPSAPPPGPTEIVKTIDPTILNYQIAANQSLEKLDAILTEQGNRALSATPVYRAGNLGNAAD